MTWLRSVLFHGFFFSWLTFLLVSFWVFLPFPRDVIKYALRVWSRVLVGAMRILGGMKVTFIGREKLPKGPVLVASKHQSIYDTFIFYLLLDEPQYVLKKELTQIPFWGWYAKKCQHIAVDRNAGAKALKEMVVQCVDRLKHGRQVIIFPEGTRTAPGVTHRYHPGVAAIYQQLPDDAVVMPVALNSGSYWGRREFEIQPGTITLEFLEPIEPGMDRKAFMKILEQRIEAATGKLLESAVQETGKKPVITP
ncbi:MAG: 1-acyl-sn-glycerol-3-phosphate acyltransferase [Rhodospirillales bacterium]|nr:1-acyl-sn-glycerol-3-phosphate acyltransferase [Rhodospirillales bacterium]